MSCAVDVLVPVQGRLKLAAFKKLSRLRLRSTWCEQRCLSLCLAEWYKQPEADMLPSHSRSCSPEADRQATLELKWKVQKVLKVVTVLPAQF